MNEVSELNEVGDDGDTGAKGKGKGKGKGQGQGKKQGQAAGDNAVNKGEGGNTLGVEGHIARMLVRAVWVQEWSAANPGSKGEARKAAWKDARPAAMEANLKTFRRALTILKKAGVTMALTADTAETASEDDDAED